MKKITNMNNPMVDFSVDRRLISNLGKDLQRPECILAERDGTLWVADARGGVTQINSNGTQKFIGQKIDNTFVNAKVSSPDDMNLPGYKFLQLKGSRKYEFAVSVVRLQMV